MRTWATAQSEGGAAKPSLMRLTEAEKAQVLQALQH